jgi:GYF domain 2
VNESTYSEDWYYVANGQKQGPINRETIKDWISSGQLSQDDLVWKTGMAEWSVVQQSDLRTFDEFSPMSGAQVNNCIVWFWALAPLLLLPWEYWWVGLLINVILWWLDGRLIKEGGQNRNGWGYWFIVLVPIYLFVRAAKLKQSSGYAILGLTSFVIAMLSSYYRTRFW